MVSVRRTTCPPRGIGVSKKGVGHELAVRVVNAVARPSRVCGGKEFTGHEDHAANVLKQ